MSSKRMIVSLFLISELWSCDFLKKKSCTYHNSVIVILSRNVQYVKMKCHIQLRLLSIFLFQGYGPWIFVFSFCVVFIHIHSITR